jgi:addiction module HigA family antidote
MKRDMPSVHPGEILFEDFLKPMGITQYRLAKSIGVPQRRIGEIIAGKRSITADTALRLARLFGTDAESWINLQAHYDLDVAEERLHDRIEREVVVYKAVSWLVRLCVSLRQEYVGHQAIVITIIIAHPTQLLKCIAEEGVLLKPAPLSGRMQLKGREQGEI